LAWTKTIVFTSKLVMSLGITLIICTYNGATVLPQTIRHIAKQRVRADIDWELVIVDNASTDNTAEVAVNEWNKYLAPAPLRLLLQPQKGLTYARELAIRNSKYDFILFCDDDNWLNPEYLNLAYDLMVKHPTIGVLGGYGELVFQSEPPLWAKNLRAYASGPQAEFSGRTKHYAVYGAGCIIRRDAFRLLDKVGFKPFLTDRLGTGLSAGGDYELCYAVALLGYDIWYDESLRFKHFMKKERLSVEYIARLYKEGAQSLDVLIPYRILLNMKYKKASSFELSYLKTITFYLRRLLLLSFKRMLLKRGSEEALQNKINQLSVIYKIARIKQYPSIRRNFKRISNFDEQVPRRSLYTNKSTI
jgi:glycosyltransferase involved in cell wall biosynthesis